MFLVEPPEPRYTVAEECGGLVFACPVRRAAWPIFKYVFIVSGCILAAALFPFTLVELMHQNAAAGQGAVVLPVVMLSVMGYAVVAIVALGAANRLLWNVAGRESVTISPQTLRLERKIPLLRRRREFALAGVTCLRTFVPLPVVPPRADLRARIEAAKRSVLETLGPLFAPAGWLAFTHAGRTVRLAIAFEEAEARQVLARIAERFPQAVDQRQYAGSRFAAPSVAVARQPTRYAVEDRLGELVISCPSQKDPLVILATSVSIFAGLPAAAACLALPPGCRHCKPCPVRAGS